MHDKRIDITKSHQSSQNSTQSRRLSKSSLTHAKQTDVHDLLVSKKVNDELMGIDRHDKESPKHHKTPHTILSHVKAH